MPALILMMLAYFGAGCLLGVGMSAGIFAHYSGLWGFPGWFLLLAGAGFTIWVLNTP